MAHSGIVAIRVPVDELSDQGGAFLQAALIGSASTWDVSTARWGRELKRGFRTPGSTRMTRPGPHHSYYS